MVLALSVACDEQGTAPASIGSEALVAAAPGLLVAGLADDLGLAPGRQAEFEAALTSLHASLLEVHETQGAFERMTGDKKRALHEDIHGRYKALLGSLTEPQRETFVARVHERIRAQHADMDLDPPALRERHGDGHREGHGDTHPEGHR
jgi:hypothetical protein